MVYSTGPFEALLGLVGPAPLARVGQAVAVLVIVGLAARMALNAARRGLARTPAHANARLLVDRLIQFGFLLVGAVLALPLLGVQLTTLAALVGVVGLAVSLALQDLLKNLVAGLYILVERPFTIGEHIDFRTFTGTVETTGLRTTVLRTIGGSRAVIPNALLFAEPLLNRSAYGRQLVKLRVAVPPAGADGAAAAEATRPDPIASGPSADVVGTAGGGQLPRELGSRGNPPGAAPARADAGRSGATGPPALPRRPASSGGEQGLVHEVLGAISAAPGLLDGAAPVVVVESLTEQKITLRAEVWAADARMAAARAAWAVRERLPGAEITVLE
jgi:small-conductance mechanosensitive channel